MKKLWICLLLCLCLALTFSAPALAVNSLTQNNNLNTAPTVTAAPAQPALETTPPPTETPVQQQTLGYVTDMAGILTASEAQTLAAAAETVSEQYGCGVYIVVVQDYKAYTNGSVETCTEDLYHHFDLGLGEGRDGIILLLSMAERDNDLWGYGPFAKTAFTDYGMDRMEKQFLPYFGQNNWYAGFNAYIRAAANLLDAAARGEPVDYEMPVSLKAAIIAGPAALIGFIVCGGLKGQMKTAKEKQTAEDYVVSGSAKLRVSTDQFINRTRTVTVIQQSSGGGGRVGGGGGTSHHSGKF